MKSSFYGWSFVVAVVLGAASFGCAETPAKPAMTPLKVWLEEPAASAPSAELAAPKKAADDEPTLWRRDWNR